MPREAYEQFLLQTSFLGGACKGPHGGVAEDQAASLVNVLLHPPGYIKKAHGYTAFANPGFAGGDQDRYIVHMQPDAALSPSGLWVFCDGTATAGGRVLYVDSSGTVTDKGSVPYGYPNWGTICLGGVTTPEAILAACGNPNAWGVGAGIANLVSGTPVRWNAADNFAPNAFAFWDDRLWATYRGDHLLYFTPRRASWATDADDWEFLSVHSPNIPNVFPFVLGQNLYVMKERGIARVEFVGGEYLYRYVLVSEQDGCQLPRAWAYVLGNTAIAFLDGRVLKLFDGAQVRRLSTDLNVQPVLDAATFDDAWMVWDPDADVLTVGFYDDASSASWGFHVHFAQPGNAGPGFTEAQWSHRIRSAVRTPLGPTSERVYFGGAGDSVLGLSPKVYQETPGQYQHDGLAYTSTVELRPLDTTSLMKLRRWPVTRRVAFTCSTGGPVTFEVSHRDSKGAYGASPARTWASGGAVSWEEVLIGVNRPGFQPQVRIRDGAATAGWELYGVALHGILKGAR